MAAETVFEKSATLRIVEIPVQEFIEFLGLNPKGTYEVEFKSQNYVWSEATSKNKAKFRVTQHLPKSE